jgi:hypothetical protein
MLANLILFAQQQAPDFSAEMPDAAAKALVGGMLIAVFIGLLVGLAIAILLLYLIFSCFQRIPARHRQMEPWQVWLLLIPVFNVVWNFFVFPKLARSYQSYFAEQGRTDVGDCGEKIGLWYAILTVAGVVLGWVPCLGALVGLASLVLFIMVLVKALTLKGQIPVGAA